MDTGLSQKMLIIQESKNGQKTLDVLHMSAYLAPDGIQNRMFSTILSDPSELEDAIELLRNLSLIECTDESAFSVSYETRSKLREHISKAGMEEDILKRVLSLSKASKQMEYPHLQSVYFSSKQYPSLIDEVCKLPGRIVFAMLRAERFLEAYDFGTVCYGFLYRTLGEYHPVVIDLKVFLALALLMMMKEKEEARRTLSEMYNTWIKIIEEESLYGTLVKLAMDVYEDELFDDASASETRLRRVVFHGKRVIDTTEGFDFEKWLLYCDILIIFGLVKRSLRILNQVIEKRRDLFGENDLGILDAMHMKGRGLIDDLKLAEALEILVDIFAKRMEKSGPRNLKTIAIQIDIARIFKYSRDFQASLKMLEEIAKRLAQIVGEDHELFLAAMTNIAEIHRLRYDFDKALELSSNLADKLESRYGVFHPKFLEYKFSLGEMLLEMGRSEAARKIYQELLEISEKTFAPAHEIGLYNLRVLQTENIDSIEDPTSLHLSAKEDDKEQLLFLLDSGENIEVRDGTGRTPLHYASQYGNVEIAKLLIERGAGFNVEELHSSTPLHLAKGDDMKTLLKSLHAFFESAKVNDIERVSGLALIHPIYLKARDVTGCTALHWAALHGHLKVLKVLLELGSDPLAVSKKLNSPLHIAAVRGRVDIAEALLQAVGPTKASSLLSSKTARLNTPLHAAAEKGFLGVVRTLLAHGAVCSAKNIVGKTPLLLSNDEGCKNLLGLVKGLFLDTNKGDVESVLTQLRGLTSEDVPAVMGAKNEKNRTLLQEARQRKHLELAKELLMFMVKDV